MALLFYSLRILPNHSTQNGRHFEDQAVISYTHYLEEIDAGRTENIPAPNIARDYYNLADDATLRDVVIAVRADEQGHAEVNHKMADTL